MPEITSTIEELITEQRKIELLPSQVIGVYTYQLKVDITAVNQTEKYEGCIFAMLIFYPKKRLRYKSYDNYYRQYTELPKKNEKGKASDYLLYMWSLAVFLIQKKSISPTELSLMFHYKGSLYLVQKISFTRVFLFFMNTTNAVIQL